VDAVTSDFRTIIAVRIEASHRAIASQWLESLERLVGLAPDDVFPGDPLLGHIPALISELAAFLRAPAHESIAANGVVTARATELGRLRYAQHASVHQVLREYRMLRTVIARFVRDEIAGLGITPSPGEVIELMSRLEAAIDVLLQTTVDTFVAAYSETITQHAQRLEGFNRMITHELRQPLGVFQFAVKMLRTDQIWSDDVQRDRMLTTVERNATRMSETLARLVALARAEEGTANALVQRVELSTIIRSVIEQLREMAESRGVEVRMAGALPVLTADVARLELIFVNLVSNAIKYTDPAKPTRMVEIAALPAARQDVCTVTVRDNGLGIAETELRSIFARFYRARPERDRELGTSGLGLGLSIVADCIDAIKGDIRVESAIGEGTTFFVELPLAPIG
jgi:signal transduction histidine kinase